MIREEKKNLALVGTGKSPCIKKFQAMSEPTGFNLAYHDLIGDISFNDSSMTFTIEPKSGQDYFNFWIKGQEFRKESAVNLEIADTSGIHIIYFDSDGEIQELVNPTAGEVETGIRQTAFICILYWNAISEESIYTGEERHGIQMDGNTHAYLHAFEGLRYASGLGLNSFSVDGTGTTADAQFGIDSGGVADEDIYQAISATASTVGFPVYYQVGDLWYRDTIAGFSARTQDGTTGTRIAWNEFTGGAWQLSEVANNDFVLYHIFATTEKDKPIISIMGQNDYATIARARKGALIEIKSLITNDLLFPEIRPLGTIIFGAKDSYANDLSAIVRSTDTRDNYIDWRSENISRVEISTTDHGSLTGLDADDHPQYILADCSRAFTGAAALAETTTPTAVDGVGKIYTKADNKLYFQDGAGTEHEIQFV